MTNSLLKDSHITQICCPHKPYQYHSSGQNKSKSRSVGNSAGNSATENQGIRVYKNKPVDKTNFCGFFSSKNTSSAKSFYTNERVKNFIKLAADKPAVFNAVFSILLTCVLRPAAIMALPEDNKHKDDKKYAAAHSIASGVIGYLVSAAIFNPLGVGVNIVAKNLDEYVEKYPKLAYLKIKNANSKNQMSNLERAKKYASQIPEAVFSPAKAIVTIALIPPILKYVFGWEKKKSTKNEPTMIAKNPTLVSAQNDSPQVAKANVTADSKPSFKGKVAVAEDGSNFVKKSKYFEKITKPVEDTKNKLHSKIADMYVGILGNKRVKNVIEKSNTPLLAAHLQTFVSLVLSGFYVKQTLSNKDLEPEKKKTLAINQTIVWAASTAGAYLLNKSLDKQVNKFIDKFKQANKTFSTQKMSRYVDGIKTAGQLMVFSFIYRFLTPVIATPIANKIGSNIQEKKQAKESIAS